MSRGLVIGKFYPPHQGHHYLISEALKGCDELMVMCLWSGVETITPEQRKNILRAVHPEALVVTVRDENPIDYSDEGWKKHIDIMADTLMEWGHKPDVVFSSEAYGDELAERLGDAIGFNVHHESVDQPRLNVPVSGTAMRKDMAANWQYLSKPARAELALRVVVCGGESTGTTTLAKDLAEHYGTPVTPEYGRYFDWGVGKGYNWCSEDFHEIAREQNEWINRMALRSQKGLVIADTDAYATAMFHEVYLGEQDYNLLEYAMRSHVSANQNGLGYYIITSHEGVEFEDDGTRMNSGKRPWMTKWFQEFLPNVDGYYQITVEGDRATRKKLAIAAVDAEIKAHHVYADPIGEVALNG